MTNETNVSDDCAFLNEIIPGCQWSTWREHREHCWMEGRNYAEAGEPPESNPYYAGGWSWRWFNEAYLEYVDAYIV